MPSRYFIFHLFHRMILACLMLSLILPVDLSANVVSTLNLPQVDQLLYLTSTEKPFVLKGLKIFPQEPFRFDYLMTSSDMDIGQESLRTESEKLVRYFLASLAVPEGDLWVNLSPYERKRIVPEMLGQTELGRDLLAQDYILKQLTSSLMHPEGEVGREFWDEIHNQAYQQHGLVDIPTNAFNKVWIVPDIAKVYQSGDKVYVTESRLKVMLDRDYSAMQESGVATEINDEQPLTSNLIRDIIIPVLEQEVNAGEHFAPLRQIYHSMILSKWYKRHFKQSLLSQVYTDQRKIDGIDLQDKNQQMKIYQTYVEAFQTGVIDLIQEEYDPMEQAIVPRKYFAGGKNFTNIPLEEISDKAMVEGEKDEAMILVKNRFEEFGSKEQKQATFDRAAMIPIQRKEVVSNLDLRQGVWIKIKSRTYKFWFSERGVKLQRYDRYRGNAIGNEYYFQEGKGGLISLAKPGEFFLYTKWNQDLGNPLLTIENKMPDAMHYRVEKNMSELNQDIIDENVEMITSEINRLEDGIHFLEHQYESGDVPYMIRYDEQTGRVARLIKSDHVNGEDGFIVIIQKPNDLLVQSPWDNRKAHVNVVSAIEKINQTLGLLQKTMDDSFNDSFKDDMKLESPGTIMTGRLSGADDVNDVRDRIKQVIGLRSAESILTFDSTPTTNGLKFSIKVKKTRSLVFENNTMKKRHDALQRAIEQALAVVFEESSHQQNELLEQAKSMDEVYGAKGYHGFQNISVDQLIGEVQSTQDWWDAIQYLKTIDKETKRPRIDAYLDDDFFRDMLKVVGGKSQDYVSNTLSNKIVSYIIAIYKFETADNMNDLKNSLNDLIQVVQSRRFARALELGRMKVYSRQQDQWYLNEKDPISKLDPLDKRFKFIRASSLEDFRKRVNAIEDAEDQLLIYHRVFEQNGRQFLFVARDGRFEVFYNSTTYSEISGVKLWNHLEGAFLLPKIDGGFYIKWFAKPLVESTHDLPFSASNKINELFQNYSDEFVIVEDEKDQLVNMLVDLGVAFDWDNQFFSRDKLGQIQYGNQQGLEIDAGRYNGLSGKNQGEKPQSSELNVLPRYDQAMMTEVEASPVGGIDLNDIDVDAAGMIENYDFENLDPAMLKQMVPNGLVPNVFYVGKMTLGEFLELDEV